MRWFCVIAALVGGVLGLARADEAPKAVDLSKIASDLRADDRATRFEALSLAEEIRPFPEAFVKPVVTFIRLDTEQALLPDKVRKPKGLVTEPKIPMKGDELSLTRLKANPDDYVEKEFVMRGGISISDYYNFKYSKAAKTHYSFQFRPVDSEGKTTSGDSAYLYLDRDLGRALAERVTKGDDAGADATLVRVRCKLDEDRVQEDGRGVLSAIELLDRQLIDWSKGEWQPWAFDGITRGFVLLSRAGAVAAPALVAIVADEVEFQNEVIDTMFRASAEEALALMDATDKRVALDHLDRAEKASRSRRALERLISTERYVRSTGERPAPPPKKVATPQDRAASLLNSARNLEKSGKVPAAIDFYRQIVKDFPESSQAKTATERIKALGGK